jgi:hypothetical protein
VTRTQSICDIFDKDNLAEEIGTIGCINRPAGRRTQQAQEGQLRAVRLVVVMDRKP